MPRRPAVRRPPIPPELEALAVRLMRGVQARMLVIDELHTYRGVFGSHVANVFRRLARVCEFYGSRPQFICTSATIASW